MYVNDEGQVTYARPVELVVAETARLGCFVRDARPIEDGLGRPIDRDDVAQIASDLDRAAAETVSGAVTLSAVSYYLERRETLIDRAWALYRRPGLDALNEALTNERQTAALNRLRTAAATPGILDAMKPVQRAKLQALLRDPATFVPCRSLAQGGQS
jgi:hypothetical protein